MSQIKIFCRLRPTLKPFKGLTSSEEDDYLMINIGSQDNIRKQPQSRHSHVPPSLHTFKFSRVFDQDASQEEVFDHVAHHMTDAFLNGYNGTIFAYGQTSSGKTYTIDGSSRRYSDRGLIPRTISYVFKDVEQRLEMGQVTSVHVSYMEIYQDVGYDLLNAGTRPGALMVTLPKVHVTEVQGGEVSVRNLSLHLAASEGVALSLLFQGSTCRKVAETSMNQHSSRSHTIFTLMLTSRSPGKEAIIRSKLHLVDLAGSERVTKTGADGLVLREARHINLSLHYLEHVIVSLQHMDRQLNRSSPHSSGTGRKRRTKSSGSLRGALRVGQPNPLRQGCSRLSLTSDGSRLPSSPTHPRSEDLVRRGHVPYRNCMLTMVLKDSLGGNCLTAMIATVSAEEENIWESVSTCRFSQRVACVSNLARRNEEVDDKVLVRKLKIRVAELEAELAAQSEHQHRQIIQPSGEQFKPATITHSLSSQDQKLCHQILNDFFHGKTENPVQAGIDTPAKFRECLVVMRSIVLHALGIQNHLVPETAPASPHQATVNRSDKSGDLTRGGGASATSQERPGSECTKDDLRLNPAAAAIGMDQYSSARAKELRKMDFHTSNHFNSHSSHHRGEKFVWGDISSPTSHLSSGFGSLQDDSIAKLSGTSTLRSRSEVDGRGRGGEKGEGRGEEGSGGSREGTEQGGRGVGVGREEREARRGGEREGRGGGERKGRGGGEREGRGGGGGEREGRGGEKKLAREKLKRKDENGKTNSYAHSLCKQAWTSSRLVSVTQPQQGSSDCADPLLNAQQTLHSSHTKSEKPHPGREPPPHYDLGLSDPMIHQNAHTQSFVERSSQYISLTSPLGGNGRPQHSVVPSGPPARKRGTPNCKSSPCERKRFDQLNSSLAVLPSKAEAADGLQRRNKHEELRQSKEEEVCLQHHIHTAHLALQEQQLTDELVQMGEKVAAQHARVRESERSGSIDPQTLSYEKIAEQQLLLKQSRLHHKLLTVQNEVKSVAEVEPEKEVMRSSIQEAKECILKVDEELEQLKMSRIEKHMQLREAATRMKIRALKQQLMGGQGLKGRSHVTPPHNYSTNVIQDRSQVTTELSTGITQTPREVERMTNSTPAQEGTPKTEIFTSTPPKRNHESHTSTTSKVESHLSPTHGQTSDTHLQHALGISGKSQESNWEESKTFTQLPLSHASSMLPPNHTPNCQVTTSPNKERSHGNPSSSSTCSSTIATSTSLHNHSPLSSTPHQQAPATTNHNTSPTRQISPQTNSHPNPASKSQVCQRTLEGHTLTLPKEIKETEYLTALQKHKSRVNKIRRCIAAATLIQRAWREYKRSRIIS